MTVILAIFALLLAAALGGALFVYRRLRRFGRIRQGRCVNQLGYPCS